MVSQKKTITYIIGLLISISTFSQTIYSEDFETNFDVDTNGWTLSSPTGNMNWEGGNTNGVPSSSGTPSGGTGPSAANSGNFFTYVESSGANALLKEAIITSPSIDLSGYTSPSLSFYYHMYGNNIGDLNIDINDGGGWTTLLTISGQQQSSNGAAWRNSLSSAIDLSAYTGSTVQIRFHGITSNTGNYYRSDFAVDDVLITGTLIVGPEINIQGNLTDIATGDTTPIIGDHTEFGSIANATTFDRTFTIQNTGTATLNLTGGTPIVDISGNAAFSVLTQPGANTIASGGDLTFVVRFAPTTDVTNAQATISIDNNDTTDGEDPYTFVVQGSSFTPAPEINIQGNLTDIASGDTTPIAGDHTEFGSIANATTFDRTFTIQNTGTATLNLTGGTPIVDISGNAAFSVLTQPGANTIASGGDVTFVVRFAPTTDITNAQATISIDNNDTTGGEDPYTFVIQGSSFTPAPEINIQGNLTDIASGDTTPIAGDHTEFGSIANSTTFDRTFTIQNTGTATLNLTGGTPIVDISGDATFSVLTQPGANTIASGGDVTFVVRFAPTTDVTNAQATISIDNNDATGSENPYTFVIQGSSFTPAPEINIQGNSIDIVSGDTTPAFGDDTEFGATITSTTIDHTFTIQNTGLSTLNLTGGSPLVAISGDAAFSILTQPSASSIASGGDVTFVVRFAPTIVGSNLQATISIANDDSDENPYTFVVQGSALLTNSPGNVSSNLQLWLRADQGIALTGTDVDSWSDQSTNGFTGTSEGTADAEYVTSGLNYNPILRFSGNSFYNLGNPSQLDLQPNTDEMTIITVVVTAGATTGTVFGKSNSSTRNYQVWFGTTDRVLHHTLGRQGGNQAVRWGTIYALNEPKITTGIVSNTGNSLTRLSPYVNGVLDPADVNNGTSTGNSVTDVLVGARRSGTNSGSGYRYNGDIAEIIMYDRDLNATEQQKVESYLSIKYGVTLGSNDAFWDTATNTSSSFGYAGTSYDYIASDGSTLWDGALNAGYGYNVFGIARDDDSNLLQQKSKSVNVIPEPILTMEAESGSLNTNLSYLLVGNNGDNIALTTSSLPIRSTNILERRWIVRESTNDPGTVTLEFDLSTSPITDTQGANLELLIADNTSFNNYKNIAGTYNATTDILTFTGINFENAEYFTLGTTEEYQDTYHLSFNGTTRYIDLGDNNDLTGNFTISAWIKSNTNNRTIISKGSAAGYEFSINSSGNLVMNFNSGTQTVTSTNSVPQNIWHHVAVIYNGTTTKIYIDGIEDGTANISTSPVANSESFLIGASGSSPSNFFSGEMDELRIWNRALTVDQLRFVMNQEIEVSGGNVYGTIIPQTVTKHETSSIPSADLLAYYPFSHIKGNCVLNESSNTTQNGRLYNLPTSSIENQTTPLPFISNANTDWDVSATWLNNGVQYIPNTTINGTNVDWNIVEINHNISVDRDLNVLALLSNSNELTINGNTALNTGHGLTITHYLKLDGSIDLEGESQLIQTTGSDFDATSTGTLERDQQGTSNTYLYNYWASPVAPTSNTNYTLPNVFNNINFLGSGYNGTALPVAVADYWIWKYANRVSDTYSEWQHIRSTGTVSPGEGFTMKGPGTATPDQNYELLGQPNNGDITLTLSKDNDYLVGNPYPSAIDANTFILDHLSVTEGGNYSNATENIINGALYFWDHFAINTHVLNSYQGGYAIYTLMGGALSISNDVRIDATGGVGTKLPERYIPVGQGFFVSAVLDANLIGDPNDPAITLPVNGGTITFRNSQRVFQKEVVSGSNTGSLFLKTNSKGKSATTHKETDPREKIRLMFDSPDGYHRQLLVGIDENASNGFDIGYDAQLIESNSEDMYWHANNSNLIIQAVNNFNKEQILPLGVKINTEGLATIKIDELKNIDSNQNIYLHDKELNTYHDLQQNDYEVYLTSGEHLERFEITFSNNNTLLDVDSVENKDLQVYFSNKKESIIVHNPILKQIKSIEVYNILGQSIYEFNTETNKNYIENKTPNIITGTYIIKMKTEAETISKKVLVK
ncbi:choice-of-anchor D domain-containing protein [Flavivirga jejuensis]|uniref:Choice-of-anchor D domain-containing protein n=1 Tax=Flavivirga jejuensis TaxID=870487 RepID=A0ABT8WTK1_9FLAO|nr:choice-of-anchor D domain-containing protein [Flavivirga jejuensis]MDO5976501.1 choice-of-anchor D domain-containing protein [Flavivirga jejuensis]